MPSRNIIKPYIENAYYHLYNRGVEKRLIFLDQQDYGVFLSYLKEYLLPKNVKDLTKRLADSNTTWVEKEKVLKLLRLNNFNGEIRLLTYCLMPNHFHLLVKQGKTSSIDGFMNSLGTRYTMYFNRKHKRVGRLYQDVYKAVLVERDEQLLHLSRYIHRQALTLPQGDPLQSQPSSFPEYVGSRKTEWVQPGEILSFFSTTNPAIGYKSFVLQEENFEIVQNLILEEEP